MLPDDEECASRPQVSETEVMNLSLSTILVLAIVAAVGAVGGVEIYVRRRMRKLAEVEARLAKLEAHNEARRDRKR